MNDVIEQEVRIEAPIGRVRQVITDPAHVARWFGSSAQLDHRPGGPLRFGWDGHEPFDGVELADPGGARIGAVMSTVDGAVFAALADPTRRALFESGVGRAGARPNPEPRGCRTSSAPRWSQKCRSAGIWH